MPKLHTQNSNEQKQNAQSGMMHVCSNVTWIQDKAACVVHSQTCYQVKSISDECRVLSDEH